MKLFYSNYIKLLKTQNSNKKLRMINPGMEISYYQMCSEENKGSLQRGMNYRLNDEYSVILMNQRSDAPYDDEILNHGETIIYEGHDIKHRKRGPDPKTVDQPERSDSGNLTQNGLFYRAATEYNNGRRNAEIVKIYEKLGKNRWLYRGKFNLVEAWTENIENRSVFKFKLTISIE